MCSLSPAQHSELQPCPVRPFSLPAAGPGPAGCHVPAEHGAGRKPLSYLAAATSSPISLPLTHFLLISPVSHCSFFLFPFSARSLWLPSFHSLLFHVFHHFFSGSFDLFDASFASGHSGEAAVPLWHGALGGDAPSEVLPRSCTNSHYHNRLKKTFKQPSDASGEPAG